MSTALGSWKEIAQFLGKGVRTVQRWEREMRLPVHRPRGKARGVVIAFPDELQRWATNRLLAMDSESLQAQSKKLSEELARLRDQSEHLFAASDHLRQELQRILKRAKELRTARH